MLPMLPNTNCKIVSMLLSVTWNIFKCKAESDEVHPIPLTVYMNNKHSCFGCNKPFPSLKRLRAHEVMCKVSKCRKIEVVQAHLLHLETAQTQDNGYPNQPPQIPILNMTEFNSEVQAASPTMHNENLAWLENDAGPSGSRHDDIPEPPVEPLGPTVSVHSGRRIRLPTHYTDYLPTVDGLRHVQSLLHSPSPLNRSPSPPEQPAIIKYQTEPDDMGLFWVYPRHPTMFLKGDQTIHSAVDAPTLDSAESQLPGQDSHSVTQTTGGLSPLEITCNNLFSAFSSPMAGLLMCWQYSGSNMKSVGELNHLRSFIQDPQIRPNAETVFSHE
ncbi:hypothetical protein JVT61DRAFT_13629 [Boletus reticuloceps]|uniref:Uncharacterized protein n=1 Tax=Boletus reticuloceps TaxID=495285 RepID=A0A8I3A3E1_9AGAM|nr:hypothetical protein JVT61DRAFT_13629 [Boletus reticuloceps]